MAPFIYKVRNDGLSVLNVQEVDNRINIASKFLSQYAPEDILVVCRRENGWQAVRLFSKATGIRVFAGRYTPGALTNASLKEFFEIKLLVVTDPWPDKNIVDDALKLGIPVVALCDTNNTSNGIDFVVPCNNKGKKSLGLIFWIFANEYLKNRKLGTLKATIEDFCAD